MSDITFEELAKNFDLPTEKACEKLGVGLTVLKKICRNFGVARWPYKRPRKNGAPKNKDRVQTNARCRSFHLPQGSVQSFSPSVRTGFRPVPGKQPSKDPQYADDSDSYHAASLLELHSGQSKSRALSRKSGVVGSSHRVERPPIPSGGVRGTATEASHPYQCLLSQIPQAMRAASLVRELHSDRVPPYNRSMYSMERKIYYPTPLRPEEDKAHWDRILRALGKTSDCSVDKDLVAIPQTRGGYGFGTSCRLEGDTGWDQPAIWRSSPVPSSNASQDQGKDQESDRFVYQDKVEHVLNTENYIPGVMVRQAMSSDEATLQRMIGLLRLQQLFKQPTLQGTF